VCRRETCSYVDWTVHVRVGVGVGHRRWKSTRAMTVHTRLCCCALCILAVMFQVSALTFNPIPVSNDTDFAVQFVDLTRDTLESVYTFEDPNTVVTGGLREPPSCRSVLGKCAGFCVPRFLTSALPHPSTSRKPSRCSAPWVSLTCTAVLACRPPDITPFPHPSVRCAGVSSGGTPCRHGAAASCPCPR
jgi:hypothetical protein